MSDFQLQILTPDIIRFDGLVQSVRVRTNSGDTTVLKNHIQYISVIPISLAILCIDGVYQDFTINRGVIHVQKDKVIIFSRATEFLKDLDKERAVKKLEKVEMKLPNLEGKDLQRQLLSKKRAENRILLANKTK